MFVGFVPVFDADVIDSLPSIVFVELAWLLDRSTHRANRH